MEEDTCLAFHPVSFIITTGWLFMTVSAVPAKDVSFKIAMETFSGPTAFEQLAVISKLTWLSHFLFSRLPKQFTRLTNTPFLMPPHCSNTTATMWPRASPSTCMSYLPTTGKNLVLPLDLTLLSSWHALCPLQHSITESQKGGISQHSPTGYLCLSNNYPGHHGCWCQRSARVTSGGPVSGQRRHHSLWSWSMASWNCDWIDG